MVTWVILLTFSNVGSAARASESSSIPGAPSRTSSRCESFFTANVLSASGDHRERKGRVHRPLLRVLSIYHHHGPLEALINFEIDLEIQRYKRRHY
ncbi:hypothetical protein BKA82DRAFT_3134341 [Pisolithus tinctorius]|nr:hypothetical protein BKA82DRAFT_3134341 [Pisolithus tinctorius]